MKLRRGFFLNIRRFLLSLILLFVLIFTVREIVQKFNGNSVIERPNDYLNAAPAKGNKVISFEEIRKFNDDQVILNSESYGELQSDSLILVILVDKDDDYLHVVIGSLAETRGIEEVLLVFSHSYYDETINEMIRSISFCRVLQIYYPYSIQLHPDHFPGSHPDDCPFDMDPKKAQELGCNGAFDPDVNGHYRKPVQSQKKHHWWWTSNFVFEKLSFTSKYDGVVIFLEDDVIFMSDFIYMIMYMRFISESLPNCELFTFGNSYIPKKSEEKDFYSVELKFWNPKNYANLLAFDVTVWNNIVSHYDIFCSFDDASWIRSLFYVSLNRRDGKRYKTMSTMTPRAFRLRDCYSYGLYNCDMPANIMRIDEFEQNHSGYWFPPFVEVYIDVEYMEDDDVLDTIEPSGGWADLRDKALCCNMTVSKIKKVVLEMKNEYRNVS